MNRDQLVPLLIAFLAVLALGASAATLNSVRHGSVGFGGSDEGIGQGDTGSSIGLESPSDESPSDFSVVSPLIRAVFVLFLVMVLVGLIIMIYRDGWRSLIPMVTAAAIFSLVVLVLFSVLKPRSSNQSRQARPPANNNTSLPSGGSLNSVNEVVPPLPDVSTAVFALLGVTVLAAAIVIIRATSDRPLLGGPNSAADESIPDQSPTTESAAVGAAAGKAADRIETDTPLSNAIYRAWQEMTTHLDLQRETSTPGEFAEAAVASGMTRSDVNELTELFEATRYGGINASEEREQQALAALRRIEREYAGEREGESKTEDEGNR